ncbi:hypothetical protein J6TS2_17440 [Heyndrickxia sporothermodurans]|nr:hypothetical protein J6TS2_17440 [Heyndrickxia sporothermodurans]
MRKIAKFLVVLLFFSLSSPLDLLAITDENNAINQELDNSIDRDSSGNEDLQDNPNKESEKPTDVVESDNTDEANNNDFPEENKEVDNQEKKNDDVPETEDKKPLQKEQTDNKDTIVNPSDNESVEKSSAKETSVIKKSLANTKTTINTSKTSKLGHIRNTSVKIYKTVGNESTAFLAGNTYTNAVYYIKQQAVLGKQTYYLISTQPSSDKGVVGWVKAEDLSTHPHVGVDKNQKTFYIKGTGNAYSKAWGGSKDLVYVLSSYKNQIFDVHLTEKVGNNTWYRGTLKGKTVWIHESYLTKPSESKTSKLGHIRSSNVKIYKRIGDESSGIVAGSTYTNKVYYIKKQAVLGDRTYYLISNEPSSEKGVVGWVKAEDLSTHPHVGVDKNKKTLEIKGTGNAYTKAWGGSKDLVYELSSFKNQTFDVHLTEKVGNNTWYRGILKGKTVWIHESYLTKLSESKTSMLGHIRSSNVKIYKRIGDESSGFLAGSTYTNRVYYIKKQAELGKQIYYLISNEPSSEKGVVGWVKAEDLSTHPHVGVDKNQKTFYIKGTGNAYTKAWGGSKDLVYELSSFNNQKFAVNLTEKVGSNIWYRGILNGKTVWIHSSYLSSKPLQSINKTYTSYNIGINQMVTIQMKVNPQTDKKYKLWIREDALKNISNGKGTVNGDNWNLRRGPGTNYATGGKVNNGTVLTLKSNSKGTDGYLWYYVMDTTGWTTPDQADVQYYINPANFTSDLRSQLQFLRLSSSANIDVNEVNTKILKGKGILAGKGSSFVKASNKHGVNEIYLISHALLETGNGTSKLANGIKYKDKTVYNMFGIGAKDSCPEECGAKYAYDAGWFTPEDAIIGGAAFVGNQYVQSGQNTLYKMRWNPAFAVANGYASHQYASDIGWAYKQTSRMYEIYNLLDSYSITLDIPKYN